MRLAGEHAGGDAQQRCASRRGRSQTPHWHGRTRRRLRRSRIARSQSPPTRPRRSLSRQPAPLPLLCPASGYVLRVHLSLAVSLLSGISGEDTENIIDRLQSMLASPLVRDAWDPAAWKCSVQPAVVDGDSLTKRGFRPAAARSHRSSGGGCRHRYQRHDHRVRHPQPVPVMCCGTTSDFALSRENTRS